MPVFDYQCTNCDASYDVYHKGAERKEDVVCPSCGSSYHKKLISAPAVSMGSSSARTDYSGSTSCETGGCCGGACGLT
jgi:putative FmdB family regulatory protein